VQTIHAQWGTTLSTVDAGEELRHRADDFLSHAEVHLARAGAKSRRFDWLTRKSAQTGKVAQFIVGANKRRFAAPERLAATAAKRLAR
jgi:hypothetical protein